MDSRTAGNINSDTQIMDSINTNYLTTNPGKKTLVKNGKTNLPTTKQFLGLQEFLTYLRRFSLLGSTQDRGMGVVESRVFFEGGKRLP